MLRTKPDSADMALCMILHDPILFGEFMRNTGDANEDKDTWPKQRFKYRWYQKDLLTDTNEYISLIGGRAIGKCARATDKILTTKGYIPHSQLSKKQFVAWSFDEHNNLVKKRAVCLPAGKKRLRQIITESGYTLRLSWNHPVLTPQGFKFTRHLTLDDEVAVLTKTPHVLDDFTYKPEEMRLLGYMIFQDLQSLSCYKDNVYMFKSESIRKDIEHICEVIDIRYHRLVDKNGFRFYRYEPGKRFHKFHPITHLYAAFGLNYIRRQGWYQKDHERHLTPRFMQLGEENLKHFFEGFFGQYGTITAREFRITVPNVPFAEDIQELLLRFGIETKIEHTEHTIDKSTYTKKGILVKNKFWNVDIVNRDDRAVYRFLTTFNIPGYRIGTLRQPNQSFDAGEHYRFEKIASLIRMTPEFTYLVQVEDTKTYIIENVFTHNSFVLEDKMIFDVVNNEQQMPETPEMILTTANQNQLTPLLDRLTRRFYASHLLKHFVSQGMNRNRGTFDFKSGKRDVRIYTRLAGSRESANVVGLHVSRAIIDEQQLYPLSTFNQLQKSINTWEGKTQVFAAGVPLGVKNTTLYYLDQKMNRCKKYRIPSMNNPYFTYADFEQNKKDYGGEDSDLFLNLILGQHGKGAEIVINRDDIAIEAFDFHNYAFRARRKVEGHHYTDYLKLPDIKGYEKIYAGIDIGFTDPTIIQCFGLKAGKWYLFARYLLQRIEIPEQEEILMWLHKHFHFAALYMDIGNVGSGMYQSLRTRHVEMRDILHGVMFQEKLLVGVNERGTSITQDSKSLGADELIRRIHQKDIVLSEIDSEGVSQLERIARQRTLTGDLRYYIIGETGRGISGNDHIFASFICFAHGIRSFTFEKKKKKLGKAQA